MKNGLLDRRERREVAARALIVEAYDRAVLTDREKQPIQGSVFSMGCRLVTFIGELFSPQVAEQILDSRPANAPGERFRRRFGDAWLRFTHFVKAADAHCLSTDAMFGAFVRGMAYICRGDGDAGVDLILPVLLGDHKVGPSVMSAIFVQVKRRSKTSVSPIDAQNHLDFFRDLESGGDERPYITLVMDLGVRNSVLSVPKLDAVAVIKRRQDDADRAWLKDNSEDCTKIGTAPRISETKERTAHTPVLLHPRYETYVSGCGNVIYKVIEQDERAQWHQLLSFDDSGLSNYPRLTRVEDILQQKPFFTVQGSYSWVDIETLNTSGTGNDEPEEDYYIPTGIGFDGEQSTPQDMMVIDDAPAQS